MGFMIKTAMKSKSARMSAWFTVFVVVIGTVGRAEAGSTVVGQLFPPPNSEAGSTVCGITFDTQANPLVLENLGAMKRVSAANAAVLVTTTLSGVDSRRSLEYRPSTGTFFTTKPLGAQDALFTITAGGVETQIGEMGGFFNFISLGLDPADNLWLLSDTELGDPFDFGGALYSVNKSTGAASLAVELTGIPNQVHALGIDKLGRFFVSTSNSIYQINPVSGAGSFVTSTGLATAPDFFHDLAYDAASDKWYGVEERRSVSPRTYYLREITGMPAVPEPASPALLVAASALGLRRRHRLCSRG
jgi:hypothetical protein